MTSAHTNRPIYLDHHASTPTDPRVLEAMLPYFSEHYGNPHSIQHVIGRKAAEAVERAREQVAALIGADVREVVFTSGATESNNIAIKGAAHFAREHQGKDHIVTAVSEHKCVLESCARLEREALARVPEARIFGTGAPRIGNTTCIAIPGRPAATQVMT
ncbi:MAG: aminotransferase class V-fold PLP-dependent enzyme, partial [Alphaproteobacteria bacterium]